MDCSAPCWASLYNCDSRCPLDNTLEIEMPRRISHRGDPEARAREWTQHITDFMGGVLADPRGRPQQQQQQAAVVVKNAQHGAQPPGAWGCATLGGKVNAAGWLQVDMAPLLGRCTPAFTARGCLKLMQSSDP